jgi:6,7-dimethyl-8-ribityllumazine synthase
MPGQLKSVSAKTNLKLGRKKIAIVVAEWNEDITENLFQGAYDALLALGINEKNIIRKNVPGSFELPLGAQFMAQKKDVAGVICLGCVIQGETPHFDYICQAVANGITTVNLKFNKPVAFGVLTTLNKKQALERAGGKYGNKGEEAAITVINMLKKMPDKKNIH